MQWSDLTSFHRSAKSRAQVLVTMVGKRGSSYRQPGARMLVRDDGAVCGSVSAGCLEDEIARATKPVLLDGTSRILTIDTRPHYGCPGQITLLMEVLHPHAGDALFATVEEKLLARKPFAVSTEYGDLTSGRPHTQVLGDDLPEARSRPGVLVQHVGRRPRIVVVGAGDDASAVAKAALLARWDVHTVATEEVQFSHSQLAARFPPDDRTAVVLLTHNLGLDVACLCEVLPLPYSYVGVIGSVRRRSEIIQGLESSGNIEVLASIDNLFCPAGLDLGASDAGEIALSILAEIQCVWSGRGAGPLRERGEPIHQGERSS
ncbi:MAG TPA: XdhC family protein [Opitutaceae bacterium]|nr:XdhC family protein [Opitutaceae bacterium]